MKSQGVSSFVKILACDSHVPASLRDKQTIMHEQVAGALRNACNQHTGNCMQFAEADGVNCMMRLLSSASVTVQEEVVGLIRNACVGYHGNKIWRELKPDRGEIYPSTHGTGLPTPRSSPRSARRDPVACVYHPPCAELAAAPPAAAHAPPSRAKLGWPGTPHFHGAGRRRGRVVRCTLRGSPGEALPPIPSPRDPGRRPKQ